MSENSEMNQKDSILQYYMIWDSSKEAIIFVPDSTKKLFSIGSKKVLLKKAD